MCVPVTSESTPDPFEAAPGGGLGALALDDLSNRADKAYDEHIQGYTAGTVLHRLYLAEAWRDDALRAALDLIFARLFTYHTQTRAAWRRAYEAWAGAAGLEPESDDDDTSTGAADGVDGVDGTATGYYMPRPCRDRG